MTHPFKQLHEVACVKKRAPVRFPHNGWPLSVHLKTDARDCAHFRNHYFHAVMKGMAFGVPIALVQGARRRSP